MTLLGLLVALVSFLAVSPTWAAIRTGYLIPNPAAARDFALGGSTAALTYPPQSASINPAGLELFQPSVRLRTTVCLNPGSAGQIVELWRSGGESTPEKIIDSARLLVHSVGVQRSVFVLAALFTEPVLREGDLPPGRAFDDHPLQGLYRNSLLFKLYLHPQVAVGGRVDRLYEGRRAFADAHSYGVILRRKGVQVGLQYQKFPPEGNFSMHPLDRRGDQTTTAALTWKRAGLSVSLQVLNLTQKSERALLEPHAGVEWRPLRAVAIRAGGAQFSRSNCWAWTAGLGLLDANWLRRQARRLTSPDDILQVAAGVVYRKCTPLSVTGVLTLAWRL